MNHQEQNREALIRHIADLEAVIRRRNEQIDNQAHNARETQRALEEIAHERDEARGALRARLGVLAEHRPLTPDAIEVALRDCMPGVALYRLSGTQVMRLAEDMHAALTEPPKRPEGAEDIERLIRDAENEGQGADNEALANYLAARLTDPTRKEG